MHYGLQILFFLEVIRRNKAPLQVAFFVSIATLGRIHTMDNLGYYIDDLICKAMIGNYLNTIL